MKRKKKYLEYDYTSVYTDRIDQMERTFLERMLPGGIIRSGTYATKEIRSGNQLEVEIYPQFTRKEKDKIPAEGLRKKNRDSQRDLNDRNSRKECERRINANFTDADIWGTFTYRPEEVPGSWEEAQKNMQNFIRKLNYHRKKLGLGPAKYIYVTELSPKGRFHHHFVTGGDVPMDLVESLWTKGDRNELRRIDRDENGLGGMAHYITKESPQGKGKKRWMASKGLKKPDVKVTHYKITSRDVAKMAADFELLPEKCRKLFGPQGYTWTDGVACMNAVNGFVYLYGRMRLPKGGRNEQGNAVRTTDKRSGDPLDRAGGGSDLRGAVLAGRRQAGKKGRKAGG